MAKGFSHYSMAIPGGTLGAGIVLFFISFLGAFAAFMENKKLLHSYFAGLLALVLFQAGTFLYTFFTGLSANDILEAAWDKAYKESPRILKAVEQEFECCGFKTILDRAVPKSSPVTCSTSPLYGYKTSCYAVLMDNYREASVLITTISVIIIIIQATTLAVTWIMAEKTPTEAERRVALLDEHSRLVADGQSHGYGS
ncbi:hypothetical protein K502DRAFT_303227 [Neoconidiobolus thromboides FSU 785]|nr:hypothetical protein K502DRAFT_303227 [Neoconidiobolus thromboides FSU 785]